MCFLRVACGQIPSLPLRVVKALSDAFCFGFVSREVNGDGQESPSHTSVPVPTSLWLERARVVLLEVELVGVLVWLLVGLAFRRQLAANNLLAVAVDLAME